MQTDKEDPQEKKVRRSPPWQHVEYPHATLAG
jgi:hypothetical protein